MRRREWGGHGYDDVLYLIVFATRVDSWRLSCRRVATPAIFLDCSFVYTPIPSISIGVRRLQAVEFGRTCSCCIFVERGKHTGVLLNVNSVTRNSLIQSHIYSMVWLDSSALQRQTGGKMDAVDGTIPS